jgi:hypothetical protein
MKILAKYHSALDLTQAAPNNYDLTPVGQQGSNMDWTKIAGQIFCSETYFDLAGLALDDKTIFPTGITCQQGSPSTLFGAAAGDNFLMLDVITTIPIEVEFGSTVITNWFNVGPGFPGSTLNYEHVLYARCQRWTTDLDTNNQFPLKADEWQCGSMSPTASDRLYSYRVILVGLGATATRIVTPSGRHVMQVEVKEEPTYEYLMRLKRSYDLQNQPDVD